MKTVVHDFHTEIFLEPDEFKSLCKPGEGENTCVWAVVGSKGFECTYHNKNMYLVNRWREGLTTAKRDGCDKIKSLDVTSCQ